MQARFDPRAQPPPQKTTPKTALIVEDEPGTLRFYLAGLKGLQEFKLLPAENGRKALDVLQQVPVDVVVTDLNMPVLDGYRLITIMSEKYPSIPIIVITSVSDDSLLTKAAELGALRVFSKPPRLSSIMEEIRAVVAKPPQGMTRGLALGSLLQLLNWERKSCTLTIRSERGVGYLYMREGELINAALGQEEGIVPAYKLLGWEGPDVDFVDACRVHTTIDMPLTEILLNMAVIRDTAPATEPDRSPAPPTPGPPGPPPRGGREAAPGAATEPWYD
jgi:CheY-like chemotaxis protein